MKINKKALKLIEKGLSSKTVSKLTESQIDILHKKMIGEATVNVSSKIPNAAQIAKDMIAKGITVTMTDKELGEEEEVTIDPNKETETQDPHQVGPSSDDGFGTEDDGMGMFEEKKDGPNPWAICHAQVGPKKTRKFERCVMSVKKQLKEGKNPVSLFLETQIERIVEKHIPPRITKGDLMRVITESEPAVAPTKPKTKPTTKPNIKPRRPSHPGKNPNPGENPAPKAKKGETKEQVAPTTKPAPVKPTTKPTTKPRPSHPGKNPNPGENPSPKAGKVSPEQAKEKVIDLIMNLIQK